MVVVSRRVWNLFSVIGAAAVAFEAGILYEEKRIKALKPLNSSSTISTSTGIDRPEGNDVLKVTGIPKTGQLQIHDSYVSFADYRTRCPSFVIERLTQENLNGPAVRKFSRFQRDMSIPPQFRATEDDYKDMNKSPFSRVLSRGHMAPAGDSKVTQQAMDATFLLGSNIVPQEAANNAGKWNQLEMFTRHLTSQFAEVFVQTGPMWVPETDKETGRKLMRFEVLGDSNVAVPTHLYKVIVAKNAAGDAYSAAFILPNAPISSDVPLIAFKVPIETVEKQAGVEVMPNIVQGHSLKDICDVAECRKVKKSPYEECSMLVADVAKMNTADELRNLWDRVAASGRCINDSMLNNFYKRKSTDLGVASAAGG